MTTVSAEASFRLPTLTSIASSYMTEKKAQGFIDIWNMASNHQDDYWPQEVAELLTRGWEVYTVDEVRVEHEADPLPTEPCGRVARSPACGARLVAPIRGSSRAHAARRPETPGSGPSP